MKDLFIAYKDVEYNINPFVSNKNKNIERHTQSSINSDGSKDTTCTANIDSCLKTNDKYFVTLRYERATDGMVERLCRCSDSRIFWIKSAAFGSHDEDGKKYYKKLNYMIDCEIIKEFQAIYQKL